MNGGVVMCLASCTGFVARTLSSLAIHPDTGQVWTTRFLVDPAILLKP